MEGSDLFQALDILETELEEFECHKNDVSKRVFEPIAEKICNDIDNLFKEIEGEECNDEEVHNIIKDIHNLNKLI